MNTTAVAWLYTLLALALVFTAGCGALLFLRRRCIPAPQMRLVWAAALLLSVVPLRCFAPAARMTVAENDEKRTVTIRIREEAAESAAVPDGAFWTETVSVPPSGERAAEESAPRGMTILLEQSEAVRARAILALFCCLWLGGAAATFLFRVADRVHAARALRAASYPCRDAKVLALYRRCAVVLGISSPPPLRQFLPGVRLSPCLCGVVRPAVYIGGELAAMPESAAKMILLHELSHLRARDPWLSLAASAAASLHWMNPLSPRVESAIAEDCEFACDANVLRICGEDARVPYISAILDVAAGIAPAFSYASLCAVREKRIDVLKRRYDRMKTANSQKHTKLSACLCVLLTVLLVFTNAAVMSSCAFSGKTSAGDASENTAASGFETEAAPVALTNPILANALAEYFGLKDASELTAAHLAAITSLEILPCRTPGADQPVNDRYVPIAFRINGGKVWVDGNMTSAGATLGDAGYCIESLPVLIDSARYDEMIAALAASEAFGAEKFASFYIMKDASPAAADEAAAQNLIEELAKDTSDKVNTFSIETGEDGKMHVVQNRKTVAEMDRDVYDKKIEEYRAQYVREMTEAYPFSEKRAMAVLDPTLMRREGTQMLQLLAAAGVLEGRALTGTEIDLTDTALMPNLTSLAVDGSFTAVNVPAALTK